VSGNAVVIEGYDPATGKRTHVLVTASGGLAIVSEPFALWDYPGAAASRVVSAAPTKLRRIAGRVIDTASADRYLMLFNATSLPANGTAPVRPAVKLSPDQEFALDMPDVDFTTGLVWALSTSEVTLTVTVANDGLIGALTR
jgi:hypothetical protein